MADTPIQWTNAFKKDYKREKKKNANLDALLMPLLAKLVNNEPLEERHHDHLLTGDKRGYRDCHIKPDLLLIYQKPDLDTLILIRLGSHAEIF